MTQNSSITEKAKKRLEENTIRIPAEDVLSSAARDALELSERYSFIKAEPHVLPLDMGAGVNPDGTTSKNADRVHK